MLKLTWILWSCAIVAILTTPTGAQLTDVSKVVDQIPDDLNKWFSPTDNSTYKADYEGANPSFQDINNNGNLDEGDMRCKDNKNGRHPWQLSFYGSGPSGATFTPGAVTLGPEDYLSQIVNNSADKTKEKIVIISITGNADQNVGVGVVSTSGGTVSSTSPLPYEGCHKCFIFTIPQLDSNEKIIIRNFGNRAVINEAEIKTKCVEPEQATSYSNGTTGSTNTPSGIQYDPGLQTLSINGAPISILNLDGSNINDPQFANDPIMGATISLTNFTLSHSDAGGYYFQNGTLTVAKAGTTFLKADIPWLSMNDYARAACGANVFGTLTNVQADLSLGSAWLSQHVNCQQTSSSWADIRLNTSDDLMPAITGGTALNTTCTVSMGFRAVAFGGNTWMGTNGSFSDPDQWSYKAASNWKGAEVNFAGATSGCTVTVDSLVTLGTLNLQGTAGYTLAAATPTPFPIVMNASLGNAAINASGSHDISAPVYLASSTDIYVLNPADTLTISGNIGGSLGLTKNGSGKLTLSGCNTYTGTTTINAGVLELPTTGQIAPESAILTTDPSAMFLVDGGSHTVGIISGTGMTSVAAGSELTATSIIQDTLTIGAGATLTIAAIPGGPQSAGDGLLPVPEPSALILLCIGAVSLFVYAMRLREGPKII